MEFTPWQLIAAGFAVLTAVIGMALRMHAISHSDIKGQLKTLTANLLILSGKIERLEGERDGVVRGVERISEEVINELNSLSCRHGNDGKE